MMASYMDCLELAGLIIMENGGEIYRVEETVTRMAGAFGLQACQAFAVPSGFFIGYTRADGTRETSVIRVQARTTNLSRVDAANAISRRIVSEGMDVEAVRAALTEIRTCQPMVSSRWMPFAAAASAAAFAVLFGGGWLDTLLAFAVCLLIYLLTLLPERIQPGQFAFALFGGLLASILPMAFSSVFPACLPDAITAGVLMPLLPGVTMTNAVRDTLRGDMVSGSCQLWQAALIAALLAGGAISGASLFRLLGGVL